jgi:hypothetical protein
MKKGSTKIYIVLGIILVVFGVFFIWKKYSNKTSKVDSVMEQKITETFLAPVSAQKDIPLSPKQEKEVTDTFLGPAK